MKSFLFHLTMIFNGNEFSNGMNSQHSTSKKSLLLVSSLVFLTVIPFYLFSTSLFPLPSPENDASDLRNKEIVKDCDIFSGKWIPYPDGPYYTDATCDLIDQHNCLKLGRPDTEFMKWRWRPDECELPLFNAKRFLELVRGKKMAFVGDSVGRNQMQSLLCLLASVTHPEDISHRYAVDTKYFKRWFFADYRFTLATLWSPFLVKSRDADPNGHSLNSMMSLHLDQADEAWASEVENFDYVIISGGQWFFRPLIYYMNGQIVGCHNCHMDNITAVTNYFGYRMAFRTAFKTLQSLKNYKGITFLRTFSPSHFENGAWNEGGNCIRTMPFTTEEMKLAGYELETYLTQVEELRKAQEKGRKRGLKFELLATTEAMLLRPDGHPNQYGRSPHSNETVADCVHWCLPGPIDTWNEFLLYMMRREAWRSFNESLQRNIT
ncbi:PMR5/CAS1P GDSL/SGNH-LIKE ACYL-ESTERASE FAMILY PROTEIN [Salix purpurea]|uniref:PMR5/CAS1P GDSL/SGNH-LIKE ACYL-ESTERASE FAMILY PROTEIN n=1 Tax=Salix purpurea TaxID=77065 RepID=A0A9Q0WFS1_SALPP|nr:PMR5/CAS1P GDSL/SGNH-LIKE ACYL-ESTERASE FAMILY PROTEIN [Salix purpurea]